MLVIDLRVTVKTCIEILVYDADRLY